MTTKKYKTVSGFLRTRDEQTGLKLYNVPDDQRVTATRADQREVLDFLLPQLGLPKLDANEELIDGISRLLKRGGDPSQLKALKDVERWLRKPIITGMRMTATVISD